jgi:hypothetical protein
VSLRRLARPADLQQSGNRGGKAGQVEFTADQMSLLDMPSGAEIHPTCADIMNTCLNARAARAADSEHRQARFKSITLEHKSPAAASFFLSGGAHLGPLSPYCSVEGTQKWN